ncbi:MAG: DUF86 domain-containing protein [bacterium]|nr:DUF86 domain-containing protein [bacterium]
MTIEKINKRVVEDKFKLIELHLERLSDLVGLSEGKFASPQNFDVAAWNLRCALESTFDICSHILSRMPGVKIDEYKQMALEMGKQKIVPIAFAEDVLYKMGGYRNRLTHFYFEVTPKEMHNIVQNNLRDFKKFMGFVKKFLEKQKLTK